MLSATASEGYKAQIGFCSGRGDYYSTLYVSAAQISPAGEPPKAQHQAPPPFNSQHFFPVSSPSNGSTCALTSLLPVSGHTACPETASNQGKGTAPVNFPQLLPHSGRCSTTPCQNWPGKMSLCFFEQRLYYHKNCYRWILPDIWWMFCRPHKLSRFGWDRINVFSICSVYKLRGELPGRG